MTTSSYRLLLVTLAALLFGCRESKTQARQPEAVRDTAVAGSEVRPLSSDFHRGVNHAHVHRRGRGYGSEISAQELDSLRSLGVGWIAITPFGYQEGATSDHMVGFPREEESLPRRRDPSLTDDDLAAEIASAHRRGMKVALKPHIWSHDFWTGAAWHGTVMQPTPQEHAKWWRSYRAFALHYAELSERAGADLYCIGTELVEMTTRYPDEWRALIGDIRKIYRGPLSYAAHWDRELDSIPFWDDLDYIGITAYFPLDAPENASVEQLVAAWGPARDRLERLAARFDRPVLFLEAGYRPVADTHREPWRYDGGRVDPEAQARAYEALFRAFADAEWWRGVYFWKTFTDRDRADRYGEDTGFAFRGRPAEQVVGKWFGH